MKHILSIRRACQTLAVIAVAAFALGVHGQTPTPTPTAAATATPAAIPAANPADVATMDSIIAACYDVISGPAKATNG